MSQPSFSFEFSPPRNDKEKEALPDVIKALSATNPRLMTVTYGAGGSKQAGTVETLRLFQKFTDCALASHLTHIASTKEQLNEYLDWMWDNNIRHIVALRGDMPQDARPRDPNGEYYAHTNDFVAAVAKRHPFHISVGAYPEKHPEAPCLHADVANLKKKCDAGATDALTQFFFNNEHFYRFRDIANLMGVTTPLIPGLMRIANFEGVQRFAAKIGTSVPDSLKTAFTQASDPTAYAEEFLFKQVEDLKRNGVEDFHFYTMNKAQGFDRSIQHVMS